MGKDLDARIEFGRSESNAIYIDICVFQVFSLNDILTLFLTDF